MENKAKYDGNIGRYASESTLYRTAEKGRSGGRQRILEERLLPTDWFQSAHKPGGERTVFDGSTGESLKHGLYQRVGDRSCECLLHHAYCHIWLRSRNWCTLIRDNVGKKFNNCYLAQLMALKRDCDRCSAEYVRQMCAGNTHAYWMRVVVDDIGLVTGRHRTRIQRSMTSEFGNWNFPVTIQIEVDKLRKKV